MCANAASMIAAAAMRAAAAEWELLHTLEVERVHPRVVEMAREILLRRRDDRALAFFDWATERDLDVEQARALVESAEGGAEEG